MERLSDKTILIGKEPGQGRLLVAVEGVGATALGEAGSVPGSVSRCKPEEGIAHAKIVIDRQGEMTICNLKAQNVTYVNSSEIVSKRINADAVVALGKDRYEISLPLVIEAAKGLLKAPAQAHKGVDISHLQEVWSRYQDELRKLREKQKKVNLVRSGCGIFTMCAVPCIALLGPVGYVLTGIGVAGNLYSFIGLRNDKTIEEQERLTEEFQDAYVCPRCGKFLGHISYRLLKRQYSMHCPYCKCEFEDKN